MDGGAWWAVVHGVAKSRTRLSDFTFTFHFHALEKGMATHSSVLAWRIPGTGEPGELTSMGSHRVGHDWSDLAAAAYFSCQWTVEIICQLCWYFPFPRLTGAVLNSWVICGEFSLSTVAWFFVYLYLHSYSSSSSSLIFWQLMGLNPGSRQWEYGVLTTGPPENPLYYTSSLQSCHLSFFFFATFLN